MGKDSFGEDFWDFKDKEEGAAFLSFWSDLVEEEGVIPFYKFTGTLKAHWSGIINYLESQIANPKGMPCGAASWRASTVRFNWPKEEPGDIGIFIISST